MELMLEHYGLIYEDILFGKLSYMTILVDWWMIDNIFGMEHENTYIADSGSTEDASLSFSTTLCSTEICIRWT